VDAPQSQPLGGRCNGYRLSGDDVRAAALSGPPSGGRRGLDRVWAPRAGCQGPWRQPLRLATLSVPRCPGGPPAIVGCHSRGVSTTSARN
jgi:hypothetical protein